MAYERESRNCLPERPTERNMRCSERGRAIIPSFWYGDADVSLYRLCSQPSVRLLLKQRRVQAAAGANAFGRSERRRKAKRFLAGAQEKIKPGRKDPAFERNPDRQCAGSWQPAFRLATEPANPRQSIWRRWSFEFCNVIRCRTMNILACHIDSCNLSNYLFTRSKQSFFAVLPGVIAIDTDNCEFL